MRGWASPPVLKGVAVGGHADGQVLEDSWKTTVGRERPYVPAECPTSLPLQSVVKIRHTQYRWEEVRCEEGRIGFWVADGWSILQALTRLLNEHRVVT